jgi:hypothetical protein
MYWAILTKPNRYPVALAHDLQKAPTYCSFAAALSGGIIAAPATINRPQKITFARTDAIALFNELRRLIRDQSDVSRLTSSPAMRRRVRMFSSFVSCTTEAPSPSKHTGGDLMNDMSRLGLPTGSTAAKLRLSRTMQGAGRDNSQIGRPSAPERMTFDGLNQGPAQHAGMANHGDPAVGTFQPIQGLQPRIEQKMAPPECANCLVRIVGASFHESKITQFGS